MFYHVIRRPLQSNSSSQSKGDQSPESISASQLMPRYHYSRTVPNSAMHTSDSFVLENNSDGHTLKPTMTTTTTTSNNNNNNNNNSIGSFKSTFIPFVTNNRTITPTMREFIQIPITREDGTTLAPTNVSRSVPITYVSETNSLSSSLDNNNNQKPTFTNFLRPTSRYFQYQRNNSIEEPTITTTSSNTSRVPYATRRLSLSIPVVNTATTTTNDDTTTIQRVPSSPIRQIPIRFPQTATIPSTPTSTSRISGAILRSSPISNTLPRRTTDLGDSSSSPTLVTITNPQQSSSLSSDFNMTSSNTLPLRRAEAMAREAIQNLTQQQQQRNNFISENSNNNNSRSPPSSRRVIINLKNNQSVSLDSHLSAAMKLPPLPSSSRLPPRNNVYRIPVLHELQMPPHPVTVITEPSLQSTFASNNNNTNNGSYKNEFHMEIPVTIITSNDQENQIQSNDVKEDEFSNRERLRSTNQTLKSILKRSSSRETVSRKNVSFMNA